MDKKLALAILIALLVGLGLGYILFHEKYVLPPKGDETWPMVICPPPPGAPQGTAQSLLLEIMGKVASDPSLDPTKRQQVMQLATECLMGHSMGAGHQPTTWDAARQKVYNAWAATCDPAKTTPDWDACIEELDHMP